MNKVIFIKQFQLSRRMQRILVKVEGETDEEYNHRIKIAKYGLEGEDRVNYQLINIYLPLICLSNVRVEETFGSAQADFVVISKDCIYILEVKNLFGSIKVTSDGEVIRIIPRRYGIEEEGMKNPFTQIRKQINIFESLLKNNGYNINIKPLIVMGNPRTAIYQQEKKYPIIRYDFLDEYFRNCISNDCNESEYQRMLEIGEFINTRNKDRFFNDFEAKKKAFVNNNMPLPKFSKEDLLLYEEFLECRRKIAKNNNMPICNVFLNRDAENLVIYKPRTKEEFIKIPGFKEKKYLLCGEEIINIIKKKVK